MVLKSAALAGLVLLAADIPMLTVSGNRTVDARINDFPLRLRIDPGAPSMPVLNPDFAERARLKAGWIGTRVAVGPVRISGKSAVIRLDPGSGAYKRRATWFAMPFTDGADASIGPGGLPARVVRFDMRPPAPGERTVSVPLADFMWGGMGTRLEVGGRPMVVRFRLDRDRTVVTAAGGALIADAHRGAFDRPPGTMMIYLGVDRPVRHLALEDPLVIGPLALDGLLVRTADFGSAAGIRSSDDPEPDPDEIVVKGGKKPKKRELRLEVGRDYLDRCSSITFDKDRKTLTLSCR